MGTALVNVMLSARRDHAAAIALGTWKRHERDAPLPTAGPIAKARDSDRTPLCGAQRRVLGLTPEVAPGRRRLVSWEASH